MANGKPNRPIRPRGGGPKGRRRVVIEGGTGRPGTGQRAASGRPSASAIPRTPREVVAPSGPATVESGVTLRDFSQALGVAMPQIIKLLMNLGTMKTATQSLTDDEVELIAAELGREVTIKHAGDDDGAARGLRGRRGVARGRARRSSRSWATSTTARRRCSTRSARRRSSTPRPAASRSTSAPTRPTSTAA